MSLPPENSDYATIVKFALSFDGYKYAGGGPLELSLLCDQISFNLDTASVDDLRACLFWVQRSARWNQCEDNNTLTEMRELVEAIRKLVKE